jgi:AraC-like DNA-binding protein
VYDLRDLRELLERHAAQPSCETVIPGLKLMRSDTVSSCMIAAVHSPLICIMVQGAKHLLVGETALEYKTGDFLISSVDLPVSAWITDASPEKPYLALALKFDPQLLANVWLDLPSGIPTTRLHRAVAVSQCPADLLEPFVRLVRLLDLPCHIPHLAPLVLREIYYRLLTSELADMLRHMALPQHQLPQVQKAISWIRHNYHKPMHIPALARLVRMSPASLHRQFKAVTAMSPLQYQKQIRLQEARQMMVSTKFDAASAGHAVGYDSPSQFSREYHRMFGMSPRRHRNEALPRE